MNKRFLIFLVILTIIVIGVVLNVEREKPVVEDWEVVLYFADAEAMYLEAETGVISTTAADLYSDTLKELVKGPRTDYLIKTIPEGVRILSVDINNGDCRVNFSQELVDNHWGGSTGERMTVYSIVNTLTQFAEIDRVKILIEGQEINTLAGHMDLTIYLEPDRELIAED